MNIFENSEPALDIKRKKKKSDKLNKEKAAESCRIYYMREANKETIKAQAKKWNEENREQYNKNLLKYNIERVKKSKHVRSYVQKVANACHDKRANKVKTCSKCGKEYGLRMFDQLHHENKKLKNHRFERRPYCFLCRKEMNKSYYQRNKEKWKKYNSRYKGYDLDN